MDKTLLLDNPTEITIRDPVFFKNQFKRWCVAVTMENKDVNLNISKENRNTIIELCGKNTERDLIGEKLYVVGKTFEDTVKGELVKGVTLVFSK